MKRLRAMPGAGLNRIDLVVHLGRQAEIGVVLNDLEVAKLRTFENKQRTALGAHVVGSDELAATEELIRERMRDVYRTAWSAQGPAGTLLSQCANIMLGGDNFISIC